MIIYKNISSKTHLFGTLIILTLNIFGNYLVLENLLQCDWEISHQHSQQKEEIKFSKENEKYFSLPSSFSSPLLSLSPHFLLLSQSVSAWFSFLRLLSQSSHRHYALEKLGTHMAVNWFGKHMSLPALDVLPGMRYSILGNEGGKCLTTYRCFAAKAKELQSKSCKMCNLEFFQGSFFNKKKVNSFPIHLFWENLQSFPSSAPFWSKDKGLKPKLSICSITVML